ncbi:MAG: DUF5722 domain-containing protein, partial [Planctomycetota bacterium]
FWFEVTAHPGIERDWVLELDYFCPSGLKGLQWRVGRPARPGRFVSLPDLPPAEGWTTYHVNLSQLAPTSIADDRSTPIRLDLGLRSGVRLSVRSITIRAMNDRELVAKGSAARLRQQKRSLATLIQDYMQRDWPAQITDVAVAGQTVTVQGVTHLRKDLYLIRRSAESVSATTPTEPELAARQSVSTIRGDGTFTMQLPLSGIDSENHVGSRWQLVRHHTSATGDGRWQVVSPARYANARANPDDDAASPQRLSTGPAKGLTCITSRWSSSMLRDLGLEHGSINIVMKGLLDDLRGSGYDVPMKIGRRTWWANRNRLEQLDANVRTAKNAGIQLAGILLIPGPGTDTPLVHPDSESAGAYAMPDLTTKAATDRYAATLDVLARRYSGHGSQGRIDHWIVHNEVDYGWQWTNMGEQPMDVFMDHYVRSMRMVDQAVRRWNPSARVFISLTHRWDVPDERPWKTYAPKSMLQWLIKHSQLEGDFPWGVAYHPYPQSLWKANTWDDGQVSDDFDTELITIKNLTVLDRFMHLPETRMRGGQVRPVICSEQGFHANQDDAEELETQAAALLYTWQQLRQCPSILAFDYHRPSDHPNEGGLRLGLRGLPNEADRLGPAKPAWKVYRAIGTPDEKVLVQRYRHRWKGD